MLKTQKHLKEKSMCNVDLKKSMKGITLIALVITIIVLLILAGVSIATLTGENGILTRANDAKEKTEEAEKDEKANLAQTEDLINQYVNGIEVEQVTDGNPGVLETEGTDTYVINSIEDLVVFAYNVREGNTYEGKTVKLGLSLDFNSTKSYVDPLRTDYGQYGYDGELKTLLTSGEGFKPIGTESSLEAEVQKVNTFKGTFDGYNNVIYGLYIDRDVIYDEEDYDEFSIGLFGYNEGTIQNLGVVNNNITVEKVSGNCNVFAGGIVGRSLAASTINNCYNQGEVTTNFVTGGIAGRNFGIIENTYNSGKITGNSNVGGIAGGGNGEYSKCCNLGNINSNSQNQAQAAGISPSGTNINKCYNVGKINATSAISTAYASGIGSTSVIIDCYNLGDVNANTTEVTENQSAIAAGISAYYGKTINNCYNVGTVTSNSNSQYSIAGGIAYGCEVQNSYNIATVKAIGGESTQVQVGGITGSSEGKNTINSYNIGKIEYEGGNILRIGAILGEGGETGTITNCSYLSSTAEKGMGTGTDVTTRVDNIEDMPDILSILGNEFKEDTNNINNGYPILQWQ